MIKIIKTFCYLTIYLITVNSIGQINIHNRKPNTLVEFSIIKNYFEKVDSKSDINFNASTPGYLLLIKNTEQIRKISSEKLMWLKGAFKAFNFKDKVEDLFENEVLINAETGKYWFPIQKSLVDFWKEELKVNDSTLIYIRAYGSTNKQDSDKWLFTINSFNSDYYDGLWEEALSSFNNNDSDNGIRCLEKLIDLDPKDGRNIAMLGYYYYDKGYPSNIELLKKADSLYTKAIELSPNYSYVYYQKALVKMQLMEYSKAWDNIEISRKLGELNIEEKKLTELENNLSYTKYLQTKN